ncbi:MAG: hypothetical protein CMG64_05300 [Candidatus Marinimicrobia bacterium]|nr:hypothetical protein [Candidatus Neomarinimicrobiota bacterium]|tara:strand:+ start:6458 stop:7765 length:1308 start_codon:yes stop_codon:yes gene_type:complete
MKSFKISKGHNINISGKPSENLHKQKKPGMVVFHPSTIKNLKTKLLIKEGDTVKIGSPLFYDKKNEGVYFVSSCSGNVEKIVFGPKRIVERIEISNKGNEYFELDNKVTVDNLLKSGLWTYFRQKPFSKIPHYKSRPKEIYISAMPTEPFAINYSFLFNNIENYLQKGVDVLKEIFNCEINVSSFSGNSDFENLKNVNHYSFNKLHPAGNVGVQIHHINPISDANDLRWYISLQDLNRIGEFFTTGKYPNRRYINISGNGLKNTGIYDVLIGTPNSEYLDLLDVDLRIISGDVLNGKEIENNKSINYHDEIVSVIKTDHKRDFLGWITPGLKKYSITNTFLSKINNNKNSEISTKVNGSIRTIIPMGNWDKVMPMNIFSEYLIKSILAEDIDMMEKLGIYECSPEDFALCSFACQSKVEVSKIIEDGLDLMESEG